MRADLFGCALLNLKQRVERREITSLYERGRALITTGDLKTHDHEITGILIELDGIDPACEEKRMLMDEAMGVSFLKGVAEVMRLILPEERKFGEAEQVLKKLYMYPNLTPDDVAQLNFLASAIRKEMSKLPRVPARKKPDCELPNTVMPDLSHTDQTQQNPLDQEQRSPITSSVSVVLFVLAGVAAVLDEHYLTGWGGPSVMAATAVVFPVCMYRRFWGHASFRIATVLLGIVEVPLVITLRSVIERTGSGSFYLLTFVMADTLFVFIVVVLLSQIRRW